MFYSRQCVPYSRAKRGHKKEGADERPLMINGGRENSCMNNNEKIRYFEQEFSKNSGLSFVNHYRRLNRVEIDEKRSVHLYEVSMSSKSNKSLEENDGVYRCYEIVVVLVVLAHPMSTHGYEFVENYPSSEMWGQRGWSTSSFSDALVLFDRVVDSEKEKLLRREESVNEVEEVEEEEVCNE